MTTNRLAIAEGPTRIAAPRGEIERRSFWIERGNRVLWGQEPTTKGDFLQPRTDLEWVCTNGSYSIQRR